MLTRQRVVYAALTLGLLAAVLVTYFYLTQWQSERALAEIVARLDREDPNWRLADLKRGREPLPDGENAAPVVLSLARALPRDWMRGHSDLAYRTQNLHPLERPSPEIRAKLQNVFAPLDEWIADAHQLGKFSRGQSDLPVQEDQIWLVLPHYDAANSLLYALSWDLLYRADRGEPREALASVEALHGVSRSLSDEPLLLVQILRVGLWDYGLGGLQRTLAAAQLPETDLARVQARLQHDWPDDPLATALQGERAFAHHVLSACESGKVPLHEIINLVGSRGDSTAGFVADRVGEVRRLTSLGPSHAWLLEHLTARLDALAVPAGERERREQALADAARSAPALARQWLDGMERRLQRLRLVRARLACAIAAVAVERYRLANGRWPAGLQDLCPRYLAVPPPDVFADGPVQLRVTGDGVVVFSVGPAKDRRGGYYDLDAVARGADLAGAACEFRLWDVSKRSARPAP